MRESQLQNYSYFTAKIANSKYRNQKKLVGMQLKIFKDYFNYNRMTDFLFELR